MVFFRLCSCKLYLNLKIKISEIHFYFFSNLINFFLSLKIKSRKSLKFIYLFASLYHLLKGNKRHALWNSNFQTILLENILIFLLRYSANSIYTYKLHLTCFIDTHTKRKQKIILKNIVYILYLIIIFFSQKNGKGSLKKNI